MGLMDRDDLDFSAFPTDPGVYLFRDPDDVVLYVGRATDLRSRIRSYFSDRLAADRGQRMVEALAQAKRVETIVTDSVLEAYVLEAHLIKRHQPVYNVADKDNKSFQYVGVTDEAFPRVLIVRGRDLERGTSDASFRHTYGPFPRGALLKDALRVLRKILPFRDSCTPGDSASRPCFMHQIGLCPGVCVGLTDKRRYANRIRELHLFFSGRKKQLLALLEKSMRKHARAREFEEAEAVRRRIVSLTYIQDVSLLKRDFVDCADESFRIEAYDIAHLGGRQAVGVMVVFVGGERSFAEYRTFTLRRTSPGDDIAGLREILGRRLGHPEWRFPNLIVTDGGKTHRSAAERVLADHDVVVPVASVVKDERHAPREVLGDAAVVSTRERDIIAANAEAHRFAMARHRKKRSQSFLP